MYREDKEWDEADRVGWKEALVSSLAKVVDSVSVDTGAGTQERKPDGIPCGASSESGEVMHSDERVYDSLWICVEWDRLTAGMANTQSDKGNENLESLWILKLKVILVLGGSMLGEPEGDRSEHEGDILRDVGISVILITRLILWYNIFQHQQRLKNPTEI
jgi:hypothetical protein